MKKIVKYGLLIIAVTVLALVNGGGKTEVIKEEFEEATFQKPVLGYCPTMKTHAQSIAADADLTLKAYGTTAEAISALKKGVVDAILVGRPAKKSELKEAFELKLRGGYTLVGKTKRLLRLDELTQKKIHTAVEKEEFSQYMPQTENVIYHNSLEEALKNGINEVVFINWDDYSDDYELLIPIDDGGNKVEKFRIPIVYSLKKEFIESIN